MVRLWRGGLEDYRGPRVLLQQPWLTTLVCPLPMLGVRCRESHYVPLEKHKFEVYTHEECLVDPWSDQWLMITMTSFCFSISVPSLDDPYTLEAFCLVTYCSFLPWDDRSPTKKNTKGKESPR